MSWTDRRGRRSPRARALAGILLAIAWALFASSSAQAADGSSWPCRQAGWSVGERWGPGPDDVVPDVPVCQGPALPDTATSSARGDWTPVIAYFALGVVVSALIVLDPPTPRAVKLDALRRNRRDQAHYRGAIDVSPRALLLAIGLGAMVWLAVRTIAP